MLYFKSMLSGVWVAGKKFGCSELIIRIAISYIYIYIYILLLFRSIVHSRLQDTSSFIFKCTVWLKSNSHFPFTGTVFLPFKICFSLIHS